MQWSTEYEPSLYLYGASSGVVFDIVVNETAAGDDLDLFGRSEQDEIIVVGAFDTICQTCQAQYCSVVRPSGTWARYLDEREGRMRELGVFLSGRRS